MGDADEEIVSRATLGSSKAVRMVEDVRSELAVTCESVVIDSYKRGRTSEHIYCNS